MFTGICPISFSLLPVSRAASLASRDKLKESLIKSKLRRSYREAVTKPSPGLSCITASRLEGSELDQSFLKFVGHLLYQVGLLLPHHYDLAAELLGNRAKP